MPIHGLDSGPHASQTEREFEVYCALGKDVLLFGGMQGHDRLGHLFQYTISLLSEQFDLIIDDFLAKPMTLRTGGLQVPRYFNGLVTRFSIAGQVGRFPRYEAILQPRAWLMSRASDCRFFNDKSVPQIVKALCTRYGMVVEDHLCGSYKTLPYVVQYRETDLDFIIRLMEHDGITFYFRHTKSEHFLVLVDANSPRPAAARPIEYRHDPALAGRGRDVIHDWTSSGEIQANEYVVNDFDYKRFTASKSKALEVVRQSKPLFPQERYQMFDYPGDFQDVARGETVDRAHLDRLEGQGHEVVAQTTICILQAGMEFELREHPRQNQNIKYLVTQAQYDIQVALYSSSNQQLVSDDFHFQCNVSAINAKAAYLPPRTRIKPVVRGPQTAVVLGPAGQEIHTDDLGRIKVRFHWERASGHNRGNDGQPSSFDDGERSCWVRVAQMWAGKSWGGLFIPRIGQEVVVSFMEGDPDRPIVTGSVYNSDNPTPLVLPRHATRSTIKSNSSLGGNGYNEFRFEDKSGAEQVFTHAQKDLESHVRNDTVEWIGNDRHMIVARNQIEKVGGDKHLEVAKSRREKVDGDKHAKVRGAQIEEVGKHASFKARQMDTKTKLNYAVEAGGAVHIKAGKALVLEAGAMISLKVAGVIVSITPAGVTIGSPVIISGMLTINPMAGIAGAASVVAALASFAGGGTSTPVEPQNPKTADDGKK